MKRIELACVQLGTTEQEKPTESVPVQQRGSGVVLLPTRLKAAPDLVQGAGPAAQFAWEEFIFGKIRNQHTRKAYECAIRQFLRHCESLGRELADKFLPKTLAAT